MAEGCPIRRINDCVFEYATNDGGTCWWIRGLKRSFIAKAFKDLLQRGLLKAGEDGLLELDGAAIKEFGSLRCNKEEKRPITMHRTRPRRVDP